MTTEIIFPNEHEWSTDRDSLLFLAIVDGQRIRCVLPIETFMDYFSTAPSRSAVGSHKSELIAKCEAAFETDREIFEKVAEKLIQAGHSKIKEIIIPSVTG